MTKEERSAYQAAWREAHPHYGRELRAYRRAEEGRWRREFEAKTKKKKVKPSTRTDSSEEAVWYPWMDQV